MDVSSLGAAYINTNLIDDQFVNRTKSAAGDVSRFEEILKKSADHTAASKPADSPAGGASKTATIDKTDKLYEQCLELEIFLVKTLISSMRNTVQKSGLVDEGFAGKMYEDMLYDEYARDYAKNANFGLAELAYLELSGQRGKVIVK
jgi:peptidoglycan hydrolase FlgJ